MVWGYSPDGRGCRRGPGGVPVNIATARRELAKARAAGFCGFCFAKGVPGKPLEHEPDCKGVQEANLRRKRAQPPGH